MKKVVIAGSGNAALCAGIAALEQGAEVLLLEKADADEADGNSRYTAGGSGTTDLRAMSPPL